MRRTRLATPPGDRDSASVDSSRLRGSPRMNFRLPFDTDVSRIVVSPGTNGSVVRVSRRVSSTTLSGTESREFGDPREREPGLGDLERADAKDRHARHRTSEGARSRDTLPP